MLPAQETRGEGLLIVKLPVECRDARETMPRPVLVLVQAAARQQQHREDIHIRPIDASDTTTRTVAVTVSFGTCCRGVGNDKYLVVCIWAIFNAQRSTGTREREAKIFPGYHCVSYCQYVQVCRHVDVVPEHHFYCSIFNSRPYSKEGNGS